ncbi:hypothetical protein BTO05_12295 [Winogradskyella sp. PC-19]|uniref:ribosomal maturation YjgA family protein n=1 Tax=unclassified Winogradskyella TaxID=2615021 RepID=UPI000B3D0F42|nr:MULTISPECIES: DUF2809 domain-containing protein [unclassified Winogradskyella]ARV10381.1 hypothetical protein BTO05_12295 [Winogradskyella sp. PC-19]
MNLQFNKTYFILALLFFAIEFCIALYLKTGFIRHTFGDYLVVILLYTGLKSIINIRVWTAAIIVLIISFSIELFQLWPVLEFFNLGNNKIAKLVFGTTFQFTDIIAYTSGVLTILHIETNYNKPINSDI